MRPKPFPSCVRVLPVALFAAAGFVQPLRTQMLAAESLKNLQGLSIDELANLQITSVSKQPEPLSVAPAAIYVITHDDIVRSGATRIPDMLRLAPNLEVFQTAPGNYVIAARGLSGNSAAQNFSNNLLVLIDGRTVYNPLFSGVFWDMQDVPAEDIERIEVTSGPSGTLWGANAVNGVIDIITRGAGNTQGAYAELQGGNFESAATLQYGGRIGSDFAYRIFGRTYYERAFQDQAHHNAHDGWSNPDGRFRLDWNNGADAVTLEGGLSYGHEGRNGTPAQDFNEKSFQASWQRTFSPTSSLQLLAYADQVQRSSVNVSGAFTVTNYDFELQHNFALGDWNSILWGAGDRVSPYSISPQIGAATSLLFVPASRTLNLAYGFVQDTMTPVDHVNLILGLKLEDDPFSGLSPLPNFRVAWTPAQGLLLWAAVSQAIRAPTPFDTDVEEKSGQTLFLTGNPQWKPTRLTAYEIGDRGQYGNASVSVSAFYNDYRDLRSIEFSPGNQLPLLWGNSIFGHIYGVEVWGNYQVAPWWRLDAGFNFQHENLGFIAGASRLLGIAQAGDDPHHQASLRSSMNFGDFSFDADFRYVGMLPNPVVPAYVELNSRIAWQVTPTTEISLTGLNLLHSQHQEWTIPGADEIPRMVFLQLRQRY